MAKKSRKIFFLIFPLLAFVLGELFFQHMIPLPNYYLAKAVGFFWFSLEGGLDGKATIKRNLGFCNPQVWGEKKTLTYEFNEDAYRGPLRSREPQPGINRVICIGDSITMGQDVEFDQSYCAQLEQLHQNKTPPIESFAMAQWGRSSWQGLGWFELRVQDYKPDVLVVAYGSNDSTSLRFAEFGIQDESIYRRIPHKWHHRLGWARGLDVFDDLFYLAWSTRKLRKSLPDDVDESVSTKGFEQTFWGEKFRVTPEQYRQNLKKFDELCQKRNIRLIFVNFSSHEKYCETMNAVAQEIGAGFIDGLRRAYDAIDEVRRGRIQPQWLAEYQAMIGREVMDAPDNEYLYVTTDHGHLNAIGHYVVAQHLEAMITETLMKPEEIKN